MSAAPSATCACGCGSRWPGVHFPKPKPIKVQSARTPREYSLRWGARRYLRLLLAEAGYEISLVAIGGWSRPEQGDAYLWARRFLDGDESLPPPDHVREFSR
jgi:hypothetical protein